MAAYMVTASEMRNKADHLEGLNRSLAGKIQILETQERALRSMWEGSSNDAFHAAFEANKGKMTRFVEGINTYVIALRQIAASYEATEQRNTTIAAGI